MAEMWDAQAQNAARRTSQRLAEQLRRMAKTPRPSGLVIPILDADPSGDDPTNLWGFNDGRVMFRPVPGGTIYQVTFSAHSVTTSGTPKPPDPEPRLYGKIYDAQWARSFCTVHGVEDAADLYYGYPGAGSAHGERKIMIGFDDATIRSDTAGGIIRKVEFRMVNKWSYLAAGTDIHLGIHNRSTAPASYSAVLFNAFKGVWPRSGQGVYWRSIGTVFGRYLRDGYGRGITINNSNTSKSEYGQMGWDSVRLRISFTK